MNPSIIRKKFIDFFARNGHEVVKSSPVIPVQDPTILFANAGMNQFKDIFLGKESRPYKRATTVQKCIRAGGKHNDLDQVGFTRRHLTFFEMLGNFSFGDYFKKEAIRFAWKFLTEDLEIDPKRLSATVHLSDDESEQIWQEEIGLPIDKITRMGDADNFWQMGETGPCGPCSEIFYDRGPKFNSQGQDERFVEIWNMVFMQYNRQENGELIPLKRPGVDTGMGFERLITILSDSESIFDTAVFAPIRSKIEQLTGISYQASSFEIKAAFNVLCDHIRSTSFMVADGGKPSNEGRGYVLRKIIRRALLFSKKLSTDKDLFIHLTQPLIESMDDAYPELTQQHRLIEKILSEETDRFFSSLEKGQQIFDSYIQDPETINTKQISGQQAFKLYDTYGFPLEITQIMAHEKQFSVDVQGFENFMDKQKELSGKNKKSDASLNIPEGLSGEFVGYEQTCVESEINWFEQTKDEFFWISTKQNPFFAACGGQVSDSGEVIIDGKSFPVTQVRQEATSTTTKTTILELHGNLPELKIDQKITLKVSESTRLDTAKNHSATHLLHAALRKVLGSHATQAGSVVDPNYLRFDFNHDKALTNDEIEQTESIVNNWAMSLTESKIFVTDMDSALRLGADAIFGEKYNQEAVRVIDFPGISIELCGGTHLKNTGYIGAFKIISDESIGIGVRRIVAITGQKALKLFQQTHRDLKVLGQKLSCKTEKVIENIFRIDEKVEKLEKNLKESKHELLLLKVEKLSTMFKSINGINFLFLRFETESAQEMKSYCEKLLDKKNDAFLFCINKSAESNAFFAGMSKALESKINLGQICTNLSNFGLKGGGNKSFIQGGGIVKNLDNLELAIIKLIENS